MRTNNSKILEKILNMLASIDLKESKLEVKDKSKEELYNYLIKEISNPDEYKVLLSSLKFKKQNILKILYEIISTYNTSSSNKIKRNLSVLNKSQYIIEQASHHGFTWADSNSCFNKVEEEFLELKSAIKEDNDNNIMEEMGDLIFTLQCYAILKNFDFTCILNSANNKFSKRFKKLLQIAKSENINLKKASSVKKERLWNKAKKVTSS